MIRFSANLGFLWTDRPLPDAIAAAAEAGFDAVECHMPYDVTPEAVKATLDDCDLSMISLNTRIGDRPGDLGVAALPGRESEAMSYIDEAIAYAVAVGCRNVSVVAGRSGRSDKAEAVYRANLTYATDRAAVHGCAVLIEPLNTGVADDYHLVHAAAGIETIEAVGVDNLALMLDCYHAKIMDDDLPTIFEQHLDRIGHIQIAAVPDRGEPVGGDVDYGVLLPHIESLGWDQPIGAEYTPRAGIDEGLAWLDRWTKQREALTRPSTSQDQERNR